jgi:2,3-dihydroxybiphenyl 1,2-dioxygenase
MSHVKELAYSVYEVTDIADWERFGTELLGMQLGEKTDGLLTLRSDQKAHRWIITPGPADDLAASGYEVASVADLEHIVAALRAEGIEVTDGGADLAAARKVDNIYVTADPIGNRVELVTGLADAPTPFHSDKLLGGFVTGAGGAGHQVLMEHGVDREEILDFYVRLLGFKISDFIKEELAPGFIADVVFLHCNGRHHTVAFGNMPFGKKNHHFMLEVSDMRDVGLAYDRCMDARQPFEMTLGMHPNDRMFSFYVRTPSGTNVEFGWGGLIITDEEAWETVTYDKLSAWGHRPQQVVADLLAAQQAGA